MSFNTAPKLLTAGQFLVISFVVLFWINGNTADSAKSDLQICVEEGKSSAECKKEFQQLNEENRIAEEKRAEEKENKVACEDAIKNFDLASTDLSRSCGNTGYTRSPLKCFEEIQFCEQNSNSSKYSLCNQGDRTGLEDKENNYKDKREEFLDISDKINDAKEKISELQQQISEKKMELSQNLIKIDQEIEDIKYKAEKTINELGESLDDSIDQSTQQIQQSVDALEDLRSYSTEEIYEKYNTQIDRFTEDCQEKALEKLNALRARLYKSRKSKRTMESSLKQSDKNEALASKYIRSCLALTKKRQNSIIKMRDRELKQNQTKIFRAERQLKIAEESIEKMRTKATTKADEVRFETRRSEARMLLQKNQVGANAQISIDALQRQIDLENSKLGMTQPSVHVFNGLLQKNQPSSGSGASLYDQLSKAESDLQTASVSLDKARRSIDRTIEQEDFSELNDFLGAIDSTSSSLQRSCECKNNGDSGIPGFNEQCKTARQYQNPQLSNATRNRVANKSVSTTK